MSSLAPAVLASSMPPFQLPPQHTLPSDLDDHPPSASLGAAGLKPGRNHHPAPLESASPPPAHNAALWRSLRLPAMIIFILGSFLLYLSLSAPEQNYCLVIDAGSSGTRIYSYSWSTTAQQGDLPAIHGTPDVHLSRRHGAATRSINKKETEPGLDKFYGRRDELHAAALRPLLTWALTRVPVTKHASTPIFLCATAGLRKLPEEESGWVLREVREALSASPFMFKDSWARMITGAEEATYGWVALNYAQGTLGSPHPNATVGALDLGGSSLEVTFQPSTPLPDSVPPTQLSIGRHVYALYARVHEGYGMNDAFDWTVEQLLQESAAREEKRAEGEGRRLLESSSEGSRNEGQRVGSPESATNRAAVVMRRHIVAALAGGVSVHRGRSLEGEKEEGPLMEVHHPCLHQGYEQRHFRRKSTADKASQEEGSRNNRSVSSGGSSGRVAVSLIGRPDAERCAALARSAVRRRSHGECTLPHCALGVVQPTLEGSFFALSGFHIVSHFFSTTFKDSPPGSGVLGASTGRSRADMRKEGLEGVMSSGKVFCTRPWEEVHRLYGEVKGADRNCFRAPYVVYLLTEGLGLREDQVVLGKGDGMSWTLGAALQEGLSVYGINNTQLQSRDTAAAASASAESAPPLLLPDPDNLLAGPVSALGLMSELLPVGLLLLLLLLVAALGLRQYLAHCRATPLRALSLNELSWSWPRWAAQRPPSRSGEEGWSE